jgi:hypothetical protein
MSGGPANSYYEVIVTAQGDGPALSNSTTPTSLLPGGAKFSLPPNFFWVPGKKIRIKAQGRISTVVTTPGNFTFDVRLGSVVAWNGGASALNVVAQTNATWDLEVELTCRAIGQTTTANLIGVGKLITRASLNAPAVGTTTGVGTVLLPDTAPAVGTGFDSTAQQIVDLFGTFSVANAANSITLHEYSLESLN